MCKGEVHGDFDLRTIPADSNPYEFCFGDLQFFWIKAAGFCKKGGMATGVDVMLDPTVKCRLHIPGVEKKGEFL
jgi:hypothetical protein